MSEKSLVNLENVAKEI